MIIRQMAVGPLMANCYIVGCEKSKEAAVIDPGDESERILMSLAKDELSVKYILNTHGHFDHIGGNNGIKKATSAPILIHSADAPMLKMVSATAAAWNMVAENSPKADRTIADGDKISFGSITLKVLHTPGHSPGGVAFHGEDVVFTGDTLFAGSIGRSDLPGGNHNTLISSVRQKLFPLGDDVKVYCGHGPVTTIGRERLYNPYFH
ncbi:MAG: MBL fold metallo-hydrolase [Gammaproteobacteria bacterium]|nr:MBL fold metallo-hydrolase [Gammaproteobacteria bacterium]